jgi:hypothetical protein
LHRDSAFLILQLLLSLPDALAAKVTVGYATVTARLMPLWIADDQGIWRSTGIDTQPILIRGAPTLVAGLASGD